MTSSQTRATASPSSPAGRSFLQRLRSPLTSKTRNYTEFYIQSDDPHRQYAPGDIISGTVVIKIVKPLRITHLVVSLHGYAQVFKNPNAPGDGYKNYSTTVGSGKGKKSGSYFGNGFVSLFEDESVLCGEGRLSEGVYHFNFELEFPSKGLPSSIEFERGTIAYMLTATMTRPTTMSATSSCETKVTLTDSIDIAPILVPKPRVISLEPISRRSRAKTPRKRPSTATTSTADGSPRTPTASEPTYLGSISESGTHEGASGPRSPSPSDVSYESQMSSGASGTEYGIRSIHTNTDGYSSHNASRTTLKGKTITATVDVLKGGFLRGDQIPIRVTVNHTKHVRSLKGIILTLYRQARVDMHPALPVAPNSKGDKTKSEEYYPKSRTGLGGLSLSSAGSSHVFRKDLCQSFAPLFVDPRTLTADVKCAVRVPDEAFPTISNVPGAMMSFKYYVEVIIDIQGKLSGLDRMVANAGLVNVPASGAGGAKEDASTSMFSTWGGNFVDTDQIRREKGVISALFEVVIGTKDSERNGKKKQVEQPLPDGHAPIDEIPYDGSHDPHTIEEYTGDYYGYDENGQYYDYGNDSAYYDAPGYEQQNSAYASYPPPTVPPGSSEQDEGLSEKERLRRAEARLLPSQPPVSDGPFAPLAGFSQGIPASAPVLPEDDIVDPPQFEASSASFPTSAHPPPPFRAISSPSPSRVSNAVIVQHQTTGMNGEEARTDATRSSTAIHQGENGLVAAPADEESRNDHSKPLPPIPPQSSTDSSGAAPDYFASSSSHVQATDDKQELNRRRLEMERSAPPTDHDDDADAGQSHTPSAPPMDAMQTAAFAPSAPRLDEEDEGLVDAMRAGRSNTSAGASNRGVSEALPQYER
ncbi:ph-response sensor protein [Coniothyrium glycines]